jgi:hypothetical protein
MNKIICTESLYGLIFCFLAYMIGTAVESDSNVFTLIPIDCDFLI